MEELSQLYEAPFEETQFSNPTFCSAFQKPKLPVLINGPEREIKPLTWGLVPYWSKSSKLKFSTANARCEDVFSKPSWRVPIKKRRCLVPFTAFIEWRHWGDKKIPYLIKHRQNKISSFGGIWDKWFDPQTKSFEYTFSIITTPANKLLAQVHNTKKRMPLILPPELENRWLDDLEAKEIEALLNPLQGGKLFAYPIKFGVSKKMFDKAGNKVFERYDYEDLPEVE